MVSFDHLGNFPSRLIRGKSPEFMAMGESGPFPEFGQRAVYFFSDQNLSEKKNLK